MSGGWLPYHLRWNKSTDRSVFMEFLTKMNAFLPLDQYCYIGFGAVHMEDFKLVHSLLSITDLTCIEQDEQVHLRQKYNTPLGCINLLPQSSNEFITNFRPEKSTIIWLDYATPSEVGAQIRELQDLLPKLNQYDVVKITLNANPNTLVHQNNPKYRGHQLFEERLKVLQDRVAENLPDEITPEMMKSRTYPQALLKTLRFSIIKALGGRPENIFLPVTSFVYADSYHQMITLMGVILERGSEQAFIEKTGLSYWDYYLGDLDEPQRIDIPDLTVRERLAIDAMLPCDEISVIKDHFEFNFANDEEDSEEKIRSYIKFYRHYPFFTKVTI